MPRIPYVTDEEAGDSPLVNAIRARRGGGLLNLDRELLHSAPFAEGWNALLGAVRTRLSIDPKLRELAMCVVAVLNEAEYEFIHHGPVFLENGGRRDQLDAVHAMKTTPLPGTLFDELEHATIALSVEMTTRIAVDDATFATLERHLDRTAVVELVGAVAAYNMVSRFLVALGVEIE